MGNNTTRETFDFKQYPDVWEYLNKQPNKTKYLVDLIREDINDDSSKIDKEVMFAIIEEYLQTRGVLILDKPNEIIDDNKLKASALKVLNMDNI
ncbi:hypothetical protein G9F71_008745 [Clostridium sp. FP2]|uniref:hypothetical protein n=1 Tax=Clostridium sp. FP2 TaxID=2724481 RepID=UPI0013E964F7|nr:hypothetical protein [Clostridium sp. FP2]MBZ9622941.1 hypothetical protein [Clostridium sp. FP2]